jgi:hypothetical protein
MGMSRTVKFAGKPPPDWVRVRGCLAEHGFPMQMRMIDGELAAPDELPPAGWHELRIGSSLGMVTVRRGPDWVEVVTWSSADMLMLHTWNAVAWAYAEAGEGVIVTDESELSPREFALRVEMPEQWQ